MLSHFSIIFYLSDPSPMTISPSTSFAPLYVYSPKKVLQNIVYESWYVRKIDIHRDLDILKVKEEIKRFGKKHEEWHRFCETQKFFSCWTINTRFED